MRIRLTFEALNKDAELPLDYQYLVASMIYATVGSASAEFAAKLHRGVQNGGRTFKLFTFSRIKTQKAHLVGDNLVLDEPQVELLVSSPLLDFIDCLVKGLGAQRRVRISQAAFQLVHSEVVLPPPFYERMRFRALSPITESQRNGEEHARFLSLEDDWSAIMGRNLIRKYEALHGREPDNHSLIWTWDRRYIAKAEREGKRLSVLRAIRGIKIRGWLLPLVVEGSRELIELGYEAGFGARNSMGFGMVEPSQD